MGETGMGRLRYAEDTQRWRHAKLKARFTGEKQ